MGNISIFEYGDYRQYLRDWVQHRKNSGQTFSFRWFSNLAGFSSPNFLKLVMDGKRDLTKSSAKKFSEALKLNQLQGEYFLLLVQLNQSKNTVERTNYALALARIKNRKQVNALSSKQYDLYKSWYSVAIRELIYASLKPLNINDIFDKLKPKVPKPNIERTLKVLEEIKLIELNSEGTGYVSTTAHITTGDEIQNAMIANFHRQMIQLGADSIDNFHSSLRDISSMTLPMPRENFLKAKKLIQDFRKNLTALCEQTGDDADIYQVNFQLFPLTQNKEVKDV